jgi:hypothetical protein
MQFIQERGILKGGCVHVDLTGIDESQKFEEKIVQAIIEDSSGAFKQS